MDVGQLIHEIDELLIEAGAERELLAVVSEWPIYAYTLVNADADSTCYLSSGMHGDEPAGPLALKNLIENKLLYERYSWLICPILNPSGLAAGTRENVDGLDINRDYLNQQTNEARSHAAWIKGKKIDLMISLHEDWESSGYYYYEINQLEDQPYRYHEIRRAVEQVMELEPAELIDGHSVRDRGWIYHGCHADEPKLWPEAIFIAEQGCPLSFTLESPSSLELNHRVDAHTAAVRVVLDLCLQD